MEVLEIITQAESEVLRAADRLARERLFPLARRMDDEEWFPEDEFRRLGAEGYLGVTAPAELGGAGMDFVSSGLVLQAFARWNHAFALSWVAHENLCLNNILRNGSDDQRRARIPSLCDGSKIGCLALTEPGAGSDALGSMATVAVREGDHYVLTGQKLFITNGFVADVALLYAKTDPSRGAHGISAFVVEMDRPGIAATQKLVKMGFRGSPTAEITLEGCRVPASNRIGLENEGVSCLMSGLDLERVMIAQLCLGVAERALDLTVEHARTRRQFGKPIGSFQMVQSRLADMYVRVETIRAYNYQAMHAVNDLPSGEGGRGAVHALSAACVLNAADSLNSVLNDAAQIHGGSSYIWETEMNRLYRAVKLLEIGAGTSEVRKLIIAGELLRD